jgi:hypothetical protein
MAKKKTQQAATADKANADYWQQQERLDLAFKSPFVVLNLTLEDCRTQQAELRVLDADFESSKAVFNKMIQNVISQNGYPDTNEKVDRFLAIAYEFVNTGMRDPKFPQNYWPLVACHAALVSLHHAQQKKGFIVDAAMTNVALFALAMMNIAWQSERMSRLEKLAANQHALTNQQQATNRVLNEANKGLAPLAKKGDKFKPGKPKGALSPLASAVKKYLAKYPAAGADAVWDALAKNPPHGHTFCDNHVGRYIEYEVAGKNTSFARFKNIVSERRLKKQITD